MIIHRPARISLPFARRTGKVCLVMLWMGKWCGMHTAKSCTKNGSVLPKFVPKLNCSRRICYHAQPHPWHCVDCWIAPHGTADRWGRGRGDRPVAPTITITAGAGKPFVGIIDRRIQIRRRQTHQRTPWHARRSCVATQLLRTHHWHGRILAPHPPLHRGKSAALASGPGKSPPYR